MTPASFNRLTDWAQRLVGEVISPGDAALDLTAGNGHDTLFLWRRVAPAGRVLAFDVQPIALQNSAGRLERAGAPIHPAGMDAQGYEHPGVYLIDGGHEYLGRYAPPAPRVVMANLGYLPGAGREVTTRAETTLAALNEALDLLLPGGRLAVIAYPGHAGGREEAEAVAGLMRDLAPRAYEVLALAAANYREAPLLWVAHKREA